VNCVHDWLSDLWTPNGCRPNVLWLAEWASEVVPLHSGMRVLDLGCGKATSSIFLAKEFGTTLGRMLANYVFDRACGKEPIPWMDRYRELRRKSLAQIDVDRQARKATRRLDTRPRHDLADYAGDYDHPSYGRITITHVEGKIDLGVSRYVRTARASALR
jgi:hypothetical protein